MHSTHLDTAFKLMRLHSNCKDGQDACVIVDHHGHVLGTGTIGTPVAMRVNASPLPCTCRGYCRSSHAVTRAINACSSRIGRAHTCYCVHAPCPDCINLLTATPIEEIVFAIPDLASPSEMLWLRHGRTWTQHFLPQSTLKDIDDDSDNP